MKEKLNIFFSCDNCYIPFLAVAIQSIEDNASKEYNYNLRILNTNTISETNKQKILTNYSNETFTIEFIDVTNEIKPFTQNMHTRDYYSKTTYFRLFIPNLFKELNKALYLDSDIIVNGDISKLYNIDIGDNYVGGINDSAVSQTKAFREYVEKTIGVKTYKDYFNAGILLMNLKKLREIDFEKKFIKLLSTVTFDVAQDQDYLNVICKNHTKIIDNSWNVMPIPGTEINIENINLIHYNLSFKPWHIDDVLYEEEFWRYAKKSIYYSEILSIKQSYNLDMQKKSELETIDLIKNAENQANDSIKNNLIAQKVDQIMRG